MNGIRPAGAKQLVLVKHYSLLPDSVHDERLYTGPELTVGVNTGFGGINKECLSITVDSQQLVDATAWLKNGKRAFLDEIGFGATPIFKFENW
ncbi:hypothetical protein BC937DRAFT_89043 [Endogone sp. FLAS-F59071]|nr:hypothetical protein BC937DRAFT_89043 [Endogone sp. FLAS-F59071]|eukprot:RUS18199.1 hypothetical protein BC937DRAFT_89043 [Endogone sp. FLAS-F59071]